MAKEKSELQVSASTLKNIEIFSELNDLERTEISKSFKARIYQKNQRILSHHDITREVFFVIGGTVRVTIQSLKGKEITFRDLHAGQGFGELSALDGQTRSADVVATSESAVAFLDAKKYVELLKSHPSISINSLRHLARLVRSLSDRLVEMSTLGAKNRIHSELLRLSKKGFKSGELVVLSAVPTHAEIASFINVERETVTRELAVLNQAGLIEKDRNTLIFKNLDELRALVERAGIRVL